MTKDLEVCLKWLGATVAIASLAGVLIYRVLPSWDPVYSIVAMVSILMSRFFDRGFEEVSLYPELEAKIAARGKYVVEVSPCECLPGRRARMKLQALAAYSRVVDYFKTVAYMDDTRKMLRGVQSTQLLAFFVAFFGAAITIVDAAQSQGEEVASEVGSSFGMTLAVVPVVILVARIWVPLSVLRARNSTVL